MTRDGDIPTIFNPRGRNRAPSVLVTDEGVANGPFAHADSVSSQQEPIEIASPTAPTGLAAKLKSCSVSLCSKSARKIYFGIWVTICVTASWVGATHCIKYLYLQRPVTPDSDDDPVLVPHDTTGLNMTALQKQYHALRFAFVRSMLYRSRQHHIRHLFLLHGRFMTRCSIFCLLWVGTNYMYILSLKILLATDVMALFATNVSFVYLLSWVILHEQFVGIRIMAVIICDTGVALLAYMDGITGSPTLGGVVLATSAAAGSAVYKVLFKKIIGEATYGQVALFFSLIGMLNAALLWPLCLGLFLTGVESMHWDKLPWPALLTASSLSLGE
ncbi:hypothetical protein GEV33_004301 [Tenebrio molitor]|uniref:Solute carrier family 35 member F3 n=1 Tax=Tenebrio molitor TaxID=7067 RepID=A0A8J6HNF3_TENMO|nr:hypothetical protein GEV33_004301 [Tenebrio molitor]